MKNISIEFIKFTIVGVINTLINLAVLYLLTDLLGIHYLISAVLAFIAAVTNSFILNKTWTFKEKLNYKAKTKYLQFFIVSTIALIANLTILYILVEFFNIWYMAAQLVGVASNLLINFTGNKLITFKPQK